MRKILLAGLMIGVSFIGSYGREQGLMTVTAQEATQMLNEADDFIDEIPEGYQDHQADAVLHALQGMTAELQQVRQSRNVTPKYSEGVEVRDINPLGGPARGIGMRLYRNKSADGKAQPLLIYFHGGGWTFGSLNSCANFCDALASGGAVSVLAVDYSLAPESPFPRGLSDCISAVEYAFQNFKELGTTPELISLGGDSSGGNLALATTLYFCENKQDDINIRSLALYYPVVDLDNPNEGSWKEYSRGYGLDGRLMEAFLKAYDDNGRAPESLGNISKKILKSPAKGDAELMKKLPPVMIISAERDILADQGKAFADKLKDVGVSVERIEFPGAVHLFITVPGQGAAFNKAVALTEEFLK